MYTCSCHKFQFGEEVRECASSWQYLKEGFMGTVFKCKVCGCLWFRTMDARGLMTHIKSKPDTNFGLPSASAPLFDLSYRSLKQEKEWFEFLQSIPKCQGKIIDEYEVPDDIVSALYYLLGNKQHKVRKWFNSRVLLRGNIFIPKRLLEDDMSGNKLRLLIYEKLRDTVYYCLLETIRVENHLKPIFVKSASLPPFFRGAAFHRLKALKLRLFLVKMNSSWETISDRHRPTPSGMNGSNKEKGRASCPACPSL